MVTRSNAGGMQVHDSSEDPAARVLRRFRLVFNAVKSHFRQVERVAGISGAQLWALSVVKARPGVGVSELAHAMDVHQSTASNLLRSLQDSGLVSADRNGDDRRTVQLKLTAKGARVMTRAPGPYTGILPEALRALDSLTLARLDRDLAKLIDELHPDKRGARIPLGARDEQRPLTSRRRATPPVAPTRKVIRASR